MVACQSTSAEVASTRWAALPDGELDDLMDKMTTFRPASEAVTGQPTDEYIAALVLDEIRYGRERARKRRKRRTEARDTSDECFGDEELAKMGELLLNDYYEQKVWGTPSERQC